MILLTVNELSDFISFIKQQGYKVQYSNGGEPILFNRGNYAPHIIFNNLENGGYQLTEKSSFLLCKWRKQKFNKKLNNEA